MPQWGPSAGADPQSFDRFAADYDRFADFEEPWLADWLAPHLPQARGRALDAGCGAGRHTLILADHFEEVLGVDISRPLIEIARTRRSHPRVAYEVRDLRSLRDPQRFDVVFSSSTLHHMRELGSALRHLKSLVAPGGAAILIDRVSAIPTPPRSIYLGGAIRDFPGDVRRYGWRRARWLFGFRTSAPWLNHLASDRYLSRHEFERRYGEAFPGASFAALDDAHAMIWHNAENNLDEPVEDA